MGPDDRVRAFALAVSVLTSVCFGLAPALHATRTDYVTPGFFETVGIPRLEGRDSTASDRRARRSWSS